MNESVSTNCRGGGSLAAKVATKLREAGVDPNGLCPADFESIDKFHLRGREATLQLLDNMTLNKPWHVLDIGSGLGGVSRTIAEEAGGHLTGVDLTQEFCDAANAISEWVNLSSPAEAGTDGTVRCVMSGINRSGGW